MLLLTAPIQHQPVPSVAVWKASVNACTSTGSPMRVPVPCASTYRMSAGSTPATRWASRIASRWPDIDGAVKPILSAPSLLIAEPRITAAMRSPSRSASASRFSTTIPTPSPGTVPAAFSSNGRQCPSGDRIPPSWYR